VELTYLASAPRELKHRKEVHFHHGTRETSARIYLHDRDSLKPGDTALCRFLFQEPMTGVYGDRIVVRSFSPLRTIAGGRLVNPYARKAKRFEEQGLKLLLRLAEGEPDEVVEAQLELAGSEGATFAQLMIMTNLQGKELESLLQRMSSQGRVFLFDKESRAYVWNGVVESLTAKIVEFLKAYHEKNPMKQGVSRGELASGPGKGVNPRLFHFLVERALKTGAVESEAEALRLPGHSVSMAKGQSEIKEGLMAAYRAGGKTPPNLKDVLADLGVGRKEAQEVLSLLLREGALTRVTDEIYYESGALNEIVEQVKDHLREQGEMAAPDFKQVTGLTRKYAIPLMEWMDKEKITLRVGDKRVLRKKDQS
jgi:selenocysteine-specific elongation factor